MATTNKGVTGVTIRNLRKKRASNRTQLNSVQVTCASFSCTSFLSVCHSPLLDTACRCSDNIDVILTRNGKR